MTEDESDDTTQEDRFPNAYLAASILRPGPEQLRAMNQFLEEEQHRLHEQLDEIENDDGSIPDDAASRWSMVKGRLDQTRMFHGLVIQPLLTLQMEEENA